jgi:hypothetical protein
VLWLFILIEFLVTVKYPTERGRIVDGTTIADDQECSILL